MATQFATTVQDSKDQTAAGVSTQPAARKPVSSLRYATPVRDYSRHFRTMGAGAVLLAIGVVITGLTYSVASSGSGGGTFLVCYGPILFGFIRLMTGFFGLIGSMFSGR